MHTQQQMNTAVTANNMYKDHVKFLNVSDIKTKVDSNFSSKIAN